MTNTEDEHNDSSSAHKKDRRFVFIVTYGRSGSTVLMRLLNSLDGYHIKGENWNTLFPLYRSFQLISHAHLHKGTDGPSSDNPWYGADQLDPNRYAQRLADVFVDEVIQPPADAQVIGFKEIRYFQTFGEIDQFLGFMQQFFTPAKFIFNSRPLDQVVQSQWWATMDEQEVRRRIGAMDDKFQEYAQTHSDHAIHMDFGTWVNNPDAFQSLMDFLGEPFDKDKVARVLNHRLIH